MNNNQYNHSNSLIHESSPYLLQHAHNPVNWYPWSSEALEKAVRENKLIIISIGYAACHWCHVMEHESFENEEVAAYMNENFVSIKVDREERPDIDQVYMNAVQLLTGRGGWPLNCICLPDGRPIYGGTYFPTAQWLNMLYQVSGFVRQQPEKAEHQARILTEGVKSDETIFTTTELPGYSIDDLNTIFANWKRDIDFIEGGQPKAPKFPLPAGYIYLLHYHYLSGNEDALRAVNTTLNKMADGGIYDQVGGGFARYSTDAVWRVPHFEKMLYDNAQLVSLYATAYQLSGNEKFKSIAEETLEFIQRELTDSEGGFYASLDADSEGEEGLFYTWTREEIQKATGTDADIITDYFNVTSEGNLEGRNILFKTQTDEAFAIKHHIAVNQLREKIQLAKKVLLAERSLRIRPGLDDKILTSWNGLMLKGYVDAYRAFDNPEYLSTALRNAEFLLSKLKSANNRLNRNYKNGNATINAFLDDYAFVIDAFIALYQATFDDKWLEQAQEMTQYVTEHFYDPQTGLFFYTSNTDEALIARKMELSDNVIPSSNSAMAKNLYVLGRYFYKDEYISMARRMLTAVSDSAMHMGIYYANWDILTAWLASEPYEVCIAGKDYRTVRREFDRHYLPNVFLSGGEDESTSAFIRGKLQKGKTTIYICRNKVCGQPLTDVEEAIKSIKSL